MTKWILFLALAIWFISLAWSDKISVLGLLGLFCGGLGFLLWLGMQWYWREHLQDPGTEPKKRPVKTLETRV